MYVANFKNKSQVESVLGSSVYNAVMSHFASSPFNRKMKRVPWRVEFHATKPKFGLHDFETMDAIAINLETGAVSSPKYCGSGVSTINHRDEQLSSGDSVPSGFAIVFITQSHGSSGNTAWYLDIVSSNVTPQISSLENLGLKIGR